MIYCNLCEYEGQHFIDYDDGYGHIYKNSTCPDCGSQPRHRSLCYYLNKYIPKDKSLRLLHFSPEKKIADILKSYGNIDYCSCDIKPDKAMFVEDIQSLTFGDKSFDIILCLHVLEHIEDDIQAIKELYRVLRDSGFALIDVPLDNSRESTYEDASITTPEARSKAYWQWDHLRLYGKDFTSRLEGAGFKVTIDRLINTTSKEEFEYYGFKKGPIFYCTK